jgi:ankyrin repeat protein
VQLFVECSKLETQITPTKIAQTPLSLDSEISSWDIATPQLRAPQVASLVAWILCYNKSLFEAAKGGDEALVQKLLLEKGVDVDSHDKRDRTPLLCAASHGNQALVKLLLKKGADTDSKDDLSETSLCYAVACERKAVVKLLLEKGVDIETKK